MADHRRQNEASVEPRFFLDCVIGYDYDEPTAVVYDSRMYSRVVAIRITADEYGIDFKDAHCKTLYARWLTAQEIWEEDAGERWWDDQGHYEGGRWVPADDGSTGPPDEPVEGWEPNPERDPTFAFCGKDEPGAVKVYQVETGL